MENSERHCGGAWGSKVRISIRSSVVFANAQILLGVEHTDFRRLIEYTSWQIEIVSLFEKTVFIICDRKQNLVQVWMVMSAKVVGQSTLENIQHPYPTIKKNKLKWLSATREWRAT